jgi:hypothetical protein
MTDHLSLGQRRIVAIALLVLLVALIWVAIVAPLFEVFQTRADERGSDLRALSRDRALLAQAPQIRDTLVTIEQSPRWGRFYPGEKPDKALVQMEGDLRELLKAPNNPTSMVAQPAAPKGSLTQLAVKVTLSMPIDQWTDALSRLQAHSKLLQIKNLTIQSTDYQAADTNPLLSIQAEIVGFLVRASGAGP